MVLTQSEEYECTCTVKTFHSKTKEKISRYWNLFTKTKTTLHNYHSAKSFVDRSNMYGSYKTRKS